MKFTWSAFSNERPNPSIERTVTSGLRPLVTAAHVKRWPPAEQPPLRHIRL